MTDVKLSTPIPASPEEVWEAIKGFNALPEWHPAVESSEIEAGGKQRRLSLVGGGEIVERLEAHDDGGRTYTYSILSSPLPVQNYTSTIRVVEGDGGKTAVEWSSDFDPIGDANEAMAAVQGVYSAGLDNLKKMFGG